MSENISFEWRLFDQVSGPASKIEASLKRAQAAMAGVTASSRRSVESWSMMGLKMGAISGIAHSLTDALFGVGRSALGMAENGARFAIQAASSRENMKLALEAVVGSASEARSELSQWSSLADVTPFKTADINAWGKAFRIAGHDAQDTMLLLKGVTAAGVLNDFDPVKVGNLVMALDHMKAMGKFDMRIGREFANANIPLEKMFKNMARIKGVSLATIREMESRGEIDYRTAEIAYLMTVRDIAGSFDALLAKGAKTTTGLLSTIESRWQQIFSKLEGGPGMKAFNGFLSNVVQLFDPKKGPGKKIKSQIHEIFDSTFTNIFGPLTGPEGKKRIEEFFDAVIGGAKKAGGYVSDMVEGFKWLKDNLAINLSPHDAVDNMVALTDDIAERKAMVQLSRTRGAIVPIPTTQEGIQHVLDKTIGPPPSRSIRAPASMVLSPIELKATPAAQREVKPVEIPEQTAPQTASSSNELARRQQVTRPSVTVHRGPTTVQIHVHGADLDEDALAKKVKQQLEQDDAESLHEDIALQMGK